MKKIKGIFVRHGLSEANVNNILVGDTDVPLAKEGREALVEVRKEVDFPPTDVYYSSNMKRAMETSQILFGEKDLHTKAGFRELNFGELEGTPFDDIDIFAIFKDWLLGEYKIDGMDTYKGFIGRVSTALDEVLAELSDRGDTSFTLVSHSCTMRALKTCLMKVDRLKFMEFSPKNAAVYLADIDYDEVNKKIVNVDFREL